MIIVVLLGRFIPELRGETIVSGAASVLTPEQIAGVPPEIHGEIGDSSVGWDDRLRIVNIGKRQQYDWRDQETLDTDIFSPKSVSFHPDGTRCYVNSLEGCQTVVYSLPDLSKIKVIEHCFPSSIGSLWAVPSGYYTFTHYPEGETRAFQGKPVEGAFSHSGRYFWVPYYRRTFDLNAQDPSAVAVIDTSTDSIIRMFETGPLPKMIAYSRAAGLIAIAHWGDNTIGLINVRSSDPLDWCHHPPLVAGKKLSLDFPLDKPVDRDKESGYKLRGLAFTPDGRYLIVSSMGGPTHIFDLGGEQYKYIGYANSGYGIRHFVIENGTLYGSRNIAGTVVAIPLDSVIPGVEDAVTSGRKSIELHGWQSCKVGDGARTLEASSDGKLLFVACNSSSEVCVIEAKTMTVVGRIRVDSYPVGLDVSEDGRFMAVTSQGRKGFGGNALNLFRIIRQDCVAADSTSVVVAENVDDCNGEMEDSPDNKDCDGTHVLPVVLIIVIFLTVFCILGICLKEWRKWLKKDKNG